MSTELTGLLRRLTDRAPQVRQWSAGWADAHLLPLLQDIHQRADQLLKAPEDQGALCRRIRTMLQERPETREIATAPVVDVAPPRAVDTVGPPVPDHVHRDDRIPNEIEIAVEQAIAALSPPTVPPAPPAPARGAKP